MKNDEIRLTLAIVAVWAALAAAYAFVPSLGMPGYVRVWGGGAALFLLLAAVLAWAGRRGRHPLARGGAASRS